MSGHCSLIVNLVGEELVVEFNITVLRCTTEATNLLHSYVIGNTEVECSLVVSLSYFYFVTSCS